MVKLDMTLDYASHELEAKRLLKEIHSFLLNKEFVAAASTIDAVIVELRLMRTAVKSHIQDA
jgi:hypothetical protein